MLFSADNVPGVPGIGIKGALELIRKFDSLEQLLSKAPEVCHLGAKLESTHPLVVTCAMKLMSGLQVTKKRQREILSSAEGVAAARLGLELVTIQTALQIPPVRSAFPSRDTCRWLNRKEEGGNSPLLNACLHQTELAPQPRLVCDFLIRVCP